MVLAEDHATPTVAVEIMYHVGSKNEIAGHTGFAHMFEHVMFTGSGHVPYGMHDKYTEGVGGGTNGSMSNDVTQYYETIPSNYLESSALWLEADRMGWLLDSLDDTKFRAQRDIVKNERRQRTDNSPYARETMRCWISRCTRPVIRIPWPGGRQHGRPVGGYRRRRQGIFPALTTRRITPPSPSRATS